MTTPAVDVDPRALAAICRKYGVVELELFGSTAKGTARSDSDVDLLYVLAPGTHLGWRIEDLAAELAILMGRPVDLVSKHYLHRLIRDEVLSSAQVLYAA